MLGGWSELDMLGVVEKGRVGIVEMVEVLVLVIGLW